VAEISAIVDRVAALLGPPASQPVPLDGGITNRNYRVRFGDRDTVLRLPGKDTGLLGIDREAERLAGVEASRLGVAPAVLAAGENFLVTAYLPAAPINPDVLRGDPAPAARALRAFHDSGLKLPTRFWVPELLEQYAEIVRARGHRLPGRYEEACELAARIAEALPLDHPVPCHDDLLPANILATAADPAQAMLVDWEYAGMGHRMFDLGNLAVNNGFDAGSEERLLRAYFGEPPTPGRRAALALMRIMSDAREAAWGVVQGAISELDFDFAQYARQHFARLAEAARDPRLEDWLSGATP
jgi:thiamine kinase-like enzyme